MGHNTVSVPMGWFPSEQNCRTMLRTVLRGMDLKTVATARLSMQVEAKDGSETEGFSIEFHLQPKGLTGLRNRNKINLRRKSSSK